MSLFLHLSELYQEFHFFLAVKAVKSMFFYREPRLIARFVADVSDALDDARSLYALVETAQH